MNWFLVANVPLPYVPLFPDHTQIVSNRASYLQNSGSLNKIKSSQTNLREAKFGALHYLVEWFSNQAGVTGRSSLTTKGEEWTNELSKSLRAMDSFSFWILNGFSDSIKLNDLKGLFKSNFLSFPIFLFYPLSWRFHLISLNFICCFLLIPPSEEKMAFLTPPTSRIHPFPNRSPFLLTPRTKGSSWPNAEHFYLTVKPVLLSNLKINDSV